MHKASFNCMMCCDMRYEMRMRFALPISPSENASLCPGDPMGSPDFLFSQR